MELSAEAQERVLQRIIDIADTKATITREDLPFIIADILESRDYQHIELLTCAINSGFYAFNDAMKRILKPENNQFPELTDFEIRIPKGGSTNALTECFITWNDGGRTFKTRGVHANQVFAGVNAMMRMLNMTVQSKTADESYSQPLERPE